MASKEFIQKRIEGKQKELDKLNKKLERVLKAQASGWEKNNPYYYSDYDLKDTQLEIVRVQGELDKYSQDMEIEVKKEQSRNVKIIIDFLELWKKGVREFYHPILVNYYKDMEEAEEAADEANALLKSGDWEGYNKKDAEYKKLAEVFRENSHGKFEEQEVEGYYGKRTKEVKVKTGKYEILEPYNEEDTLDEAKAKLDSALDQEANRKYDFIIERTQAIVGTITDASFLEIGAKNDLNGYIIGTDGVAKVDTIGAGGWNIQCFHFRTLINEANAEVTAKLMKHGVCKDGQCEL